MMDNRIGNSYLVKTRKRLVFSARSLSILILGFNTLFVFLNPDAYLGIADYYVFLVAFIGIGVFSKVKLKKTEESQVILFLLFYLVVSIIIASLEGAFSTGYILSYTVYLLFALLLINFGCTEHDINRLISFYIFGALLIALLILIQRYDFYGSGNERHTIQIMNNAPIDPNFLAAYLVFPGLMSFARALKKFNLSSFIITFIIGGSMLFTSSRGAMLSAIIGGAIILTGYFEGNNKVKRIIIILTVVVVGYLLMREFVPQNSIIRLFKLNSYNDRSNTKRLLDWRIGMETFKKRPVLGYGVQGEMSIINKVLGVRYISHNTYIAFLLQLGVIGSIVPFFGIIRIVQRIKKNKVLLGGFIANLSVAIFISAEVALFFWIPLVYIMVIADYEQTNGVYNGWL